MKTGWIKGIPTPGKGPGRGTPFSVPIDTQRVLRQLQKFPPEMIAVKMTFPGRAPAFFALIKAIRENKYTGHSTAAVTSSRLNTENRDQQQVFRRK
jgi:hypothetical protein